MKKQKRVAKKQHLWKSNEIAAKTKEKQKECSKTKENKQK